MNVCEKRTGQNDWDDCYGWELNAPAPAPSISLGTVLLTIIITLAFAQL